VAAGGWVSIGEVRSGEGDLAQAGAGAAEAEGRGVLLSFERGKDLVVEG
jgi:hypothetical protein